MIENSRVKFFYPRLLRLRQLIQTDFVQKVMAALASRGIVLILGFITSIFTARLLGPEGRGLFGIATAITALGVQLGLLGFHSANTFHVSKNPSLLPTMITNSFVISMAMGVLLMGLIFCLRHYILGKDSLSFFLLCLCLVNIPLNICFLLFQGLLTGLQKFKNYNRSEVLNKLINTLLILGCIFTGNLSPITATVFQGAAFMVSIIYMLKAFFKSPKGLTKPSLSLLKENFFYGGKAYLACFFAWGIMRLDIFMLQRFQNLEAVGYFSLALTLIDILLMFSSVVAAILHPKLCIESDLKKKWIMTKKTTLGSSVVILLAACIVIVWKAPIQWMFGAEFIPCHRTLLYLLPGFFFLSIQTILAQYIISIKFPWSLVTIWGVALGFKFLFSLVLVPDMGIKGIGISWAIIYFFVLISVFINIHSNNFKSWIWRSQKSNF